MIDADERYLPLLRAAPHRWGSGMVHQVDVENDKTLCGKTPDRCPGERFGGPVGLITCKVCVSVRETRARNAEWERKYAEQQAKQARPMNFDARQRQWQSDYREYRLSPIWLGKRARVLLRANDMCEGCGCRRAWQGSSLYAIQKNCRPEIPMIGSGKKNCLRLDSNLSRVP